MVIVPRVIEVQRVRQLVIRYPEFRTEVVQVGLPPQKFFAGRQPAELTAERLVRIQGLPLNWLRQREYLGFPSP